jgi:hypothetical protein
MATLKTHYNIGSFGQPVDDFSFAFIAPLSPYHNNITHLIILG